jgi:hypothetical protein
MRMLLHFCLVALASGCATKQVATTYWTTKGGVVVVHHVVGKLDTTEKLEQKRLSEDKLKAVNLLKGNYFEVLEGHDQVISRAASVPPKKNTEKPKKDSLTELSEQLRALKNQVKTVEAENQRLQNEMNAPERQKTAQAQPAEEQAGAQPDVRLSQ